MAKKRRGTMFNLFGNIEQSKINAKVSAGIELFIAKKRCVLMNVGIKFESEKRKGSTFPVWMEVELQGARMIAKPITRSKSTVRIIVFW